MTGAGTWVAVAARAHGLGTHLVDDDALGAVDDAADRGALVAALDRAGFPRAILGDGSPEAIEAAALARAGDDLTALARWARGAGAAAERALAVILDDEDRRALRALIRGLAAGAPIAACLAAAIPTPRLPDAELRELAAAASPADLVARLRRRGHPLAAALATPLAHAPVDLYAAEHAMARAFARRARAGAPAGPLAVHVAQVVDVENAGAALMLAARGDVDVAAAMVPGGAHLGRAAFRAAAAGPVEGARDVLAGVFVGTPLVGALRGGDADALDRAALRWHLETQRRLRVVDPAGPAAVVWLVLRRRAEVRRVRRAAWRVAMGGGR